MSSVQENVVKRWWEELWNYGNLSVTEEIVSPDFINHDPSSPWVPAGIDGVKALAQAYHVVFPDMHFSVERQVAVGDTVVSHWRVRGTQKGELMGLAPTGKVVEAEGISIFEVVNGKVSRQTVIWDTLGMLQRLGAKTMPPEAAS
jgi:steroid delta-isomerase-like uncharacterized protein